MRQHNIPLLPGYRPTHPPPVKGTERREKPQRLVYYKNTMYDFGCPKHEQEYDADTASKLASTVKNPTWRCTGEFRGPGQRSLSPEEKRALTQPRHIPAWVKHDKQVCRFFAYTQESVTESAGENSRIRYCTILYYLEDATIALIEKKSENSGLPQGALLNRHCIMRADGSGMMGLDDLQCGRNVEIYSRVYRIVDCDAFTRWYYAQNGQDAGPAESVPLDAFEGKRLWEKEWSEQSAPKEVVEGQIYNEKAIGGGRYQNVKLEQFMKNDLRVLRFYCFWDDKTVYGIRQYYILSYFLADNSIQIADVHQRNSGRDPYPVFFKKGTLKKNPVLAPTPGTLEPEADIYLPKDLKCGDFISVYGRKLFIYDADPFTKEFYRRWLDTEQVPVALEEPPSYAIEFPIPPHVGVGTEEDTLGSCFALWPKPPKQDLMKLMTKSAMILRYEAEIASPTYPEDADRRFIIAYSLGDDQITVYEMKRRNSGFMEGKFAEKSKKKNPDTGEWYTFNDLFVGNVMTVCSVGFRLLRPDEYTMAYMEANPSEYPMSDINSVRAKLLKFLEQADKKPTKETIYSPDEIQSFGCLSDQEIITLIRKYGSSESPEICMGDLM